MTSLTFHYELSINQLHFILHTLVLWLFYRNSKSTTRRCFRRIWLLGSLQNVIFVAMCACSDPSVPHTVIRACAPCRSYGHRHAHSHCMILMTTRQRSCLIEEYRYSILSHGSPECSLLSLRSATTLSTDLGDHAHHWASLYLILFPCTKNTFSCEKNHAEKIY